MGVEEVTAKRKKVRKHDKPAGKGAKCSRRGASCPPACCGGLNCVNGACVTPPAPGNCPAPQVKCAGTCIDITTRTDNCGACGVICDAGWNCENGVCVAPVVPCGQGGPCTVFVTSTTYDGNLKQYDPQPNPDLKRGLAGANEICRQRAQAAGLPGTYMAWLSDSTGSPSTNFLTKSTGPYYLVDGTTKVADSWADLTDGSLDARINMMETGQSLGDTNNSVWTDTAPNGTLTTLFGGLLHCENWSVNTAALNGWAGETRAYDTRWTSNLGPRCDTFQRLYCFQQS